MMENNGFEYQMLSERLVKGALAFRVAAHLADEIWREHYTPLIGLTQVEYMLENFQSKKAMQEQVSHGMAYYVVYAGKTPVGYYSIKPEEDEHLFLSKIYVRRSLRGAGVGAWILNQVCEKAHYRNRSKISLTVNKGNASSIAFYERVGFKKAKGIVADIGNGFVMDDWRMVLNVSEHCWWGSAQSPFGMVWMLFGFRGVRRFELGKPRKNELPYARDDGKAQGVCDALFSASGSSVMPRVDIEGTPFQHRVWCALRAIPRGTFQAYGDVARSLGVPNAVRAVASAIAKNPIAVLVPCHRVVPSSGGVGEYRWGQNGKLRLLRWEGVAAFSP
jgi:diamine N-acetyltransferase